MQPPVHDFKQKLTWSQAASDEPFWNAVYRKAFPDMVSHVAQTGDVPAQRLGIDRHIILTNGVTLRVDEKKRERDYADILLEFVSNDVTRTPGWIEKQLQIDYLAYAFMPSQRVYLFPWLLLRRAWLHYKADWLKTYRKVVAQNQGYRTHSVAVPIKVLQRAVQTAALIKLEPSDYKPVAALPTQAEGREATPKATQQEAGETPAQPQEAPKDKTTEKAQEPDDLPF